MPAQPFSVTPAGNTVTTRHGWQHVNRSEPADIQVIVDRLADQADASTARQTDLDTHTAAAAPHSGHLTTTHVDTNASPAALHHTLGTGANNAAAGNHGHTTNINRVIDIEADAFQPLSGSPAQQLPVTAGSDKFEIQFADGATSAVVRSLYLPVFYTGGAITVRLWWYTPSAAQAVHFDVLAAMTGIGGSVDPVLAVVAGGNFTSNATAGRYQESVVTWATNLPLAGQVVEFGIQRVPGNAADTSVEAARLRRVVLEYS